MTVLRADELSETHPHLPPGWSKAMAAIKRIGGPWQCGRCGVSYLSYKCSQCGRPLDGERTNGQRMGVTR